MRALRRAVLSYWYATIEGHQAALIEAANACLIVNLLDEAVFEPELGQPYKGLRGTSAGGRVVTGLGGIDSGTARRTRPSSSTICSLRSAATASRSARELKS